MGSSMRWLVLEASQRAGAGGEKLTGHWEGEMSVPAGSHGLAHWSILMLQPFV